MNIEMILIMIAVMIIAVLAVIIVIMQLNMKKTVSDLNKYIEMTQRESDAARMQQLSEHNVRMEELTGHFNRTISQIGKSLGAMEELASDVDSLKRLMSNVKTRGIVGELQLGALLEEMLAPGQYEENAAVKGGSERVEFAVKIPSEEGAVTYLPIDSKFPGDAYLNLLDAYDSGDRNEIRKNADILKRAIIKAAIDIKDKYIYPPLTTDFAIMFLPFEGLYAEVLRMNIVEAIQREFKVSIAGPTTLAAMLSSLQMGFRSVALRKNSGEVWDTLEKARTEFDKFNDILVRVQGRLEQTQNDLEQLVGTRTRAIQKSLKNVSERTDI